MSLDDLADVDVVPDSEFLRSLRLTGDLPQLTGGSAPSPRPVVFGGQLIGQMAVAGARVLPGKSVRSVQILFARAGEIAHDLLFDTEVLHSGRTVGSVRVRAHQEAPGRADRLVAEALVLLGTEEEDLINHTQSVPDVPGPDALDVEKVDSEEGSELRMVGGPAVFTAETVSEATTHAWVRFEQAADPQEALAGTINQALLAWYTDGFLIGTAMRPHQGLGQESAHETVSTGVLTHTITFHAPGDPTGWNLITQTSTYAGAGRCYGTGSVYSLEGVLLASFAQDGMIRAFPKGEHTGSGTRAM